MRKNNCLFLSLLLLPFLCEATVSKSLKARMSYCSFYSPQKGPYIESYLTIDGNSVCHALNAAGKYQASIEATIIFQRGDSIYYFDKYNLLGPETNDTVNAISDFTDLQRVSLPNGDYVMELTIRDKHQQSAKPYTVKQPITVLYPANIIAFSDIELLKEYNPSESVGKLYKNGFDMVPLVDNFFSKSDSSLKFYCEYYHTEAILDKEPFLLSWQILQYESKNVMEGLSGFARQTPKEVGTLLREFNIAELPSGNYNLQVSIRDKNNNLLAEKECFFQRSNPPANVPALSGELSSGNGAIANTFVTKITNRDTLAEYIRCLWPICSPNENTFAINQLENANMTAMQQFFYDFWVRRNASQPLTAWMAYKAEVNKVNAAYTIGRKKGYLTERGRVYLKYGAPNQISRAYNEPSTYPYEIWQYYALGDQSNRKFVFICQELGSNDFRLLHSDARGEIYEAQWMVILKRRTESLNDVDKTNSRSTYGNQFEQLFQNPR